MEDHDFENEGQLTDTYSTDEQLLHTCSSSENKKEIKLYAVQNENNIKLSLKSQTDKLSKTLNADV